MGETDPAAARRPSPACCIVNRLTAVQSEAARIIFDLSEADGFCVASGFARQTPPWPPTTRIAYFDAHVRNQTTVIKPAKAAQTNCRHLQDVFSAPSG